MSLLLGATAPDFTAETTHGTIRFHNWIGGAWCVLFSHPKDFTPVCTTELGAMARLAPEFERRGVKVIGLSVDPTERHVEWSRDIEDVTGASPTYPLISDPGLEISKLYGMLPAAEVGSPSRTAADNHTVRSVFVIGPDKRIKLMLTYPMSTGRDFGEILRIVDSLQLTANHKVATPADWRRGDEVIILPSIPDDEARRLFPNGWRAPKPYMRIVEQPA
ncbi:MAG: peroxiredoxin [Inquilinaceae bacterium]